MPSEPPRIYLDSCAYIACIQKEDGRYDTLSEIFSRAKAGDIVLVASTMVIAEVTSLRDSTVDRTAETKLLQSFFESEFIKVRAVDRRTAEEAADISNKHSLKPPDAIHVATAIRWNCSSLQTYDSRMTNCDGAIGTPPLKIEEPRIPGEDGLLF